MPSKVNRRGRARTSYNYRRARPSRRRSLRLGRVADQASKRTFLAISRTWFPFLKFSIKPRNLEVTKSIQIVSGGKVLHTARSAGSSPSFDGDEGSSKALRPAPGTLFADVPLHGFLTEWIFSSDYHHVTDPGKGVADPQMHICKRSYVHLPQPGCIISLLKMYF